MLGGFTISEMRDLLGKEFTDSFSFKLYPVKPQTIVTPDYDKAGYYGLDDSDIKQKLYFPQYKRDHEINFMVHQGNENTYFDFLLTSEDGTYYVGTFGFKDRGDVPAYYIPKFLSKLMEFYSLPIDKQYEDGGMMDEDNFEGMSFDIDDNKVEFVRYIVVNRDILLKHYDDVMQWTEIGKKSNEYNNLLQAIKSFDDEIKDTPYPKLKRILFNYHVGELDDIAANISDYKDENADMMAKGGEIKEEDYFLVLKGMKIKRFRVFSIDGDDVKINYSLDVAPFSSVFTQMSLNEIKWMLKNGYIKKTNEKEYWKDKYKNTSSTTYADGGATKGGKIRRRL
jgi:hypothetical protein